MRRLSFRRFRSEPLESRQTLSITVDTLIDTDDYVVWSDHFRDNPADDPPGVPMNGDGVVDGLD